MQRCLTFRSVFVSIVITLIGGDLVGLAAQPAAAREKPAWQGGPFHNPGVFSRVVKGMRYEWIATEDVNFEIRPNGKVKIVAPLTKKSSNGANDCRRFIFDHLHKRLVPAEAEALFGPGLALPPGNYGFAILWLNAGNYDEILNRAWDLMIDPKTFPGNSAQVDYFYISIVPVTPPPKTKGPVREVVVPQDLQRVSWLPHYQMLPYALKLPPGKGFGVTRLLFDVPLDEIYKKVTHIQYAYSMLDSVPANKKWKTKQAYDNSAKIASIEWLIQNHPMDRDFITAAEMDENFGNHGFSDHSQRAQKVLEGIYHRMEKELGVKSPNETRLYDDYFGALAGYDNSMGFRPLEVAVLTEGLSSQAAARPRWFNGKWENCAYFSDGAYKYRNWMQGGYLDSYVTTPEGIRIYNEIYNYERKFIAAPDRRVIKFGWSNAEGVNANSYRSGTKWRLHFENGDIIRAVEVAWPFHMMLNESFWALLLGNDYVLWHSSVPMVSDINAFGDSWCAGAGKTQWQPTGGKIVEYDPNNPKHPKRYKSQLGQFPPNPHMGESGAFAGAWLVGQITAVSDRTSKTIAYCPFTYKINNGKAEPGYADSSKPKKGERGTADLSRYGAANPGQANIVTMFAAKKPICIYTEGKDGAAVIYHNVYCGLTDVNDVVITTPKGKRVFRATGNSLHVYYVDRTDKASDGADHDDKDAGKTKKPTESFFAK